MSKNILLRLLGSSVVFFSLFLIVSSASAAVVTYPAPAGGIPLSSAFTVSADGNNVDVYQVKVPPKFIGYTPCPTSYETAAMAYFDFSGTVNVRITSAVPISSVAIRPLRHNIQPVISGNTITFSLSSPANLSIEINGDDRHNLHLFANPLEVNKPSPTDPNVMYYGPGIHGDGSTINVGSGKTVYIAGGAIIYGSFAAQAGNATIRGRGILSEEKTPCGSAGHITVILEKGTINLEGFVVLDTSSWTFIVIDADNFNMDNVKSIGWRGNGDGLDLTSVSRATVKNVFIRSTDDIFAMKSDPYFMTPTGRPTENITIQDSVNWADGAGHAIAFMEQTIPYMRNILFKNIDIIHSYTAAFWMDCCDAPGEQYNVTLDDVRVEDMDGSYDPYVFKISPNGNGNMHDIYVNNFQLLGGRILPSIISGSDSSHRAYNITFNNLKYFGNLITNANAGQFQIGNYTSNIQFTTGGTTPTPPPPPAPPPPPPTCTNLWNSTLAVPASFGGSFNWFTSAKELLINVLCSSGGTTVNVGNGSILEYIYKTGYIWQNNQWTPFNYAGQTMDSSGNWFIGSATANLSIADLTQKQSVLVYICDWDGAQWHCGCHDQACTTGFWNLQQFKQ